MGCFQRSDYNLHLPYVEESVVEYLCRDSNGFALRFNSLSIIPCSILLPGVKPLVVLGPYTDL